MNHTKPTFLISFVVFLLVACTPKTMTPTPIGEPVAVINTVVATPTPPTATQPLPTPVPSATFTPTPTNTPTVTPTPPPTATATPPAIPTPPGVDVLEQVLWLYETNNGCQLPCWWGITPGQTQWSVAEEFLHRFDLDIYQVSSTPWVVYYGISVPLPQQVFSIERTELGILVRDGVVDMIETDVSIGDTPPDTLNHYRLSVFLATYGEPTEVWLATFSSSPGGGPGSGGLLPFVIVLFYSDQGIAGLYDDLGERVGDMVRGCPQEYPVSTLELWTPHSDFTFEQLVDGSSAFVGDYLSLEEATGLDVATFYETFRQPENRTCLQTPADLWR